MTKYKGFGGMNLQSCVPLHTSYPQLMMCCGIWIERVFTMCTSSDSYKPGAKQMKVSEKQWKLDLQCSDVEEAVCSATGALVVAWIWQLFPYLRAARGSSRLEVFKPNVFSVHFIDLYYLVQSRIFFSEVYLHGISRIKRREWNNNRFSLHCFAPSLCLMMQFSNWSTWFPYQSVETE